MRLTRVYFNVDLSVGYELELPASVVNRLHNVLRLNVNDKVVIFNGRGGEYLATILVCAKRSVIVRLDEYRAVSSESNLVIHLAQVISRGEKMDFTLQKAVELGVAEITPLLAERCNVRLSVERSQKRLEHWCGVINSACEQCGRTSIPRLNSVQTIDKWLESCDAGTGVLLQPDAKHSLSQLNIARNKPINLLIGCEGGFTPNELELAVSHQFTSIKFGPRVLRTETAALAVISALQTLWGDVG